MRHRKKTFKFGRKTAHRLSMLANLTCSLIEHGVITTTLAKAKAMRPYAEKMVTLAKGGTLHDRRLALARLQQKSAVSKLFKDVVPANADRNGGYTRIVKLGRGSDWASKSYNNAEMARLEWVAAAKAATTETAPADEKKPKKEKAKAEAAKA